MEVSLGKKLLRMRFPILTDIGDVGFIAFVGCNIQMLIRLVIPLRLNSSTVLNVSVVSIYHISIVSFLKMYRIKQAFYQNGWRVFVVLG